MGFVPQDDVLHGDLTVEEVLLFSARVRLPSSASGADHRCHVDRALKVQGHTFHLSHAESFTACLRHLPSVTLGF